MLPTGVLLEPGVGGAVGPAQRALVAGEAGEVLGLDVAHQQHPHFADVAAVLAGPARPSIPLPHPTLGLKLPVDPAHAAVSQEVA